MANIIDDISQQIISNATQLQTLTNDYILKAFGAFTAAAYPQNFVFKYEPTKDYSDTWSNLINRTPTQFLPTTDLRVSFNNEYDQLVQELSNRFPSEYSSFIYEYFPSFADSEDMNELSQFLSDNLANGTIGLSPAVEQQIWDQAKERDLFDAKRAEKIALRSAGQRGTSYLQPTINYSLLQAKNDAIRNQSGTNRQIAVDSAKLKIDFMKTTISSIIECQKLATDSALNYLQQIMSSYTLADNKARDYVGAYTQFYQSINAYYDSLDKVSSMQFRASSQNQKDIMDYYKYNLDYVLTNKDMYTKLGLGAANVVGSEAASAFSGLNVLAGYGNITNS